jgi:hypothetical protein
LRAREELRYGVNVSSRLDSSNSRHDKDKLSHWEEENTIPSHGEKLQIEEARAPLAYSILKHQKGRSVGVQVDESMTDCG